LFCVRHGGGRRCQIQDCNKHVRGKSNFCAAHEESLPPSAVPKNQTNTEDDSKVQTSRPNALTEVKQNKQVDAPAPQKLELSRLDDYPIGKTTTKVADSTYDNLQAKVNKEKINEFLENARGLKSDSSPKQHHDEKEGIETKSSIIEEQRKTDTTDLNKTNEEPSDEPKEENIDKKALGHTGVAATVVVGIGKGSKLNRVAEKLPEKKADIVEPREKKRFKPVKSKRIANPFAVDATTKANVPNPESSPSSSERRFVFHPINNKNEDNKNGEEKPKRSSQPTSNLPRDPAKANPSTSSTNASFRDKYFTHNMTVEDAIKEQERLLQAAAARVRTQARAHVSSNRTNPLNNSAYTHTRTFAVLITDVHKRFFDHWQYHDPYARLGLPRTATDSMIKSQYRKLALVYHPDRNVGSTDTKHKFQAVTEAYHSLMNNRR
jgi:hypothetical protein